MTGKVSIFYNYNNWVDDPVRERHECHLNWYALGEENKDSYESIIAHAHSFAEAREKALAIFRMLPPSEELVVE